MDLILSNKIKKHLSTEGPKEPPAKINLNHIHNFCQNSVLKCVVGRHCTAYL